MPLIITKPFKITGFQIENNVFLRCDNIGVTGASFLDVNSTGTELYIYEEASKVCRWSL